MLFFLLLWRRRGRLCLRFLLLQFLFVGGLRDLARENDARGDIGHCRERKEQQHCLQLAARREHDGGQPQQTAHHIQRRHRLLLVESHIHHAMVNVPAVRRHGALPARHAAHDGKGRVEDRQAQHQKRHRERNDSVILKQALNGIGR